MTDADDPLATVKVRIANIESELEALKAELVALSRAAGDDRAEVTALKADLAVVRGLIAAQGAVLGGLASRVDELASRLSTAGAKVAAVPTAAVVTVEVLRALGWLPQ